MKEKIIKIVYCILLLIGVFLGLFLLIKPLSKVSEYASYDTKNEVSLYTFESTIIQRLYIEKDRVFRIMLFLDGEKKYDNLSVQLIDKEGREILNTIVEEYKENFIYFDFYELKKDSEYNLIITDLDGDNLELASTKSTDNNYLIGNNAKTLQLVTYYRENAYLYLWYPIFLLAVLYTLFPFVWEERKNEK